jgi:hypothetical protein
VVITGPLNNNGSIDRSSLALMKTTACYDQDLRAIGQALDLRGITVFELKNEPGRYVVRGTADKASSVLASVRRLLMGTGKEESSTFNYNAQEIERLEREGKKKRVKAGRLPDFYSLSNTLRTLGAYLDSKNAELLELHKRPLSVTLLYQTTDGHPHMEDRTLASFFNVFIEMHGKRGRLPN